jgi:hypothetical protein
VQSRWSKSAARKSLRTYPALSPSTSFQQGRREVLSFPREAFLVRLEVRNALSKLVAALRRAARDEVDEIIFASMARETQKKKSSTGRNGPRV